MEPPSKATPKLFPNLADLEREVAAEGRAWMRQRFEERVQQLAKEHRELFPPAAASQAKPHPAQRVRRGKAGG